MTEPFITEAGKRTAVELMGEGGAETIEANAERWVRRVDESWAHIISNFVVNGMYSRDVLPTSTRELCAVAALAVLGRSEELDAHIRMALRTNPPDQVREVIVQMAVYGGVPVALAGMKIFERALEEGTPPQAV